MRTTTWRRRGLALAAVTTITTLTACGSSGSSGSADDKADGAAADDKAASRLVVSYEGGISVLDGETLEPAADLESEEFTRLNPAGDGRHVMVTTSEGFQVLDAGTREEEPELTGAVFEADTPGHVVSHGGKTVLYADGTSDSTIFDTDSLTEADGELPESETVAGTEAHHGVSIVLEDGTFLTTVGDADTRSGVVAQDPSGEVVAEDDDCPGVHGEGTAADEAVVFGCEDGALLYRDGEFTKLDAPDQPYGRMGNAYVSETSPVVVGDYNTDPDAEGYLLDAVTIIDTEEQTLDVVDLPDGAEYTFRDVARGPDGLAYIIATDGSIHVLDPETQEVTDSFPVVEPWEGPAEWQDPHPSIKVEGDTAYVTEPATREVHAVDLTDGEVLRSTTLEQEPNEMAVATAAE